VTDKLSHRLSWALRHGAGELGLAMDAAGWVAIDELLAHLSIGRADLDDVVAHNNKSRFQVEGARVRAAQGHSRANMPVTCEALEASWSRFDGAESVWHGTNLGALAGIAAEGILPGGRTHVHLAAELDSRVGKRARVDVMLEVSVAELRARGLDVFVSPNGVVLARSVPAACIAGIVAITRAARDREASLRQSLPFRNPEK
jgi:putative RNA 2'-phosphotransferase